MKNITRTFCSAALGLAATTLLLVPGSGVHAAGPFVQQVPPDPVPPPANLVAPVSTACVRDAIAQTTTCDLVAEAGTADVGNGQTLPVWVFDEVGDPTTDVLNPVLEMVEGDVLTVNLTNQLSVATGFSLPFTLADGEIAPDIVGTVAGAGASASYTGLTAGTYIYQPSPTPAANRQLAMGMGGILIVRPAGYDAADAATYELSGGLSWYTDEIIAVVHEFDPSFNGDPMNADLAQFTPSVFTLNGQSYDGNTPLPQIQPGSRALVRAANLGLQQRRVGFTGARIEQVTQNSRPLLQPLDQAALTVLPGGVVDGLSTLPTTVGINVALFDHHLSTWQGSGSASAGQVEIWEIPGVGSPIGPAITSAEFPDVYHGVDVFDGVLPALFELTSEPGARVRYFIDDLGPSAIATPVGLVPAGGLLTGALTQPTLSPLANGDHVLWLQAGVGPAGSELWGPVSGLVFEMYRTGPVIAGLDVTPTLVDGNNVDIVTVTGTADTTLTGPGSDVQIVRYTIDTPPVPDALGNFDAAGGTDLALDGANPQRASFSGDIDVAALGLGEGVHTVYVFAKDTASTTGGALGLQDHWSQVVGEVTFTVDTTPPVVDSVAISPNPNNGTTAYDGSQIFLDAVRLSATISDTGGGSGTTVDNSAIVEAEFGVGDPSLVALGSGDPLESATAMWGDVVSDQYVQDVYADIPLADIRSFPEGTVDFWVRGRDAAGNWSDAQTATLTLDFTAPVITLDVSGVAGTVQFDVVDNGGVVNTNIALIEVFEGADPGVGNGTPVAVNGTPEVLDSTVAVVVGVDLTIRALDEAGNESTLLVATSDTTGPDITFGTPVDGGTVLVNATDPATGSPVPVQSNIVSIEWFDGPTAGAAGSGTDVPVAGDSPTVTDVAITGLLDGQEITVVVTDAAGNATEATTNASVAAPDTEAPVITVSPDPQLTGEVTFTVTDNGTIATVEYWLSADPTPLPGDGTPAALAGETLTGLGSGTEITIRAIDAAGNSVTATATAGA